MNFLLYHVYPKYNSHFLSSLKYATHFDKLTLDILQIYCHKYNAHRVSMILL
jgi:hypothetical protein